MFLLVASCSELDKRKAEADLANKSNKEQGIGYFSSCERCNMPWNKCKSGSGIMITESSGISPLCKWCEKRTTPAQRVEYYRMWHLRYNSGSHDWSDIKQKVLESN